jgi:hypothetical protein
MDELYSNPIVEQKDLTKTKRGTANLFPPSIFLLSIETSFKQHQA